MNQHKKNFYLRWLGQKVLGYFLRGLLVAIPILATWGIFSWLTHLFEKNFPGINPFLSFVSILIGLTVLGMFATGFITKPLFELMDTLLEKAPGIKFIYGTVKDMTEAFVGDKKKFTEPALVQLQEGVYKLGFITQKSMESIGMPGYVTVYMPFSYALSGEVLIVDSLKVTPVSKDSSEVTKFIISGGITHLD